LKRGDTEIELDFSGKGGYKPGQKIKFLIEANSPDDALEKEVELGTKVLNRISLVYRCKFILSSFNYILPGEIGEKNRKCHIVLDKENGKYLNSGDICEKKLNEIINAEFRNVNENILSYFRRASFCGVSLHNFISLFNVLELLSGTEKLPRKCDKCRSELKCRECGWLSTYDSTTKNLLRETWGRIVNKTFLDKNLIENIIDMRPKIVHASEFLEFDELNDLIKHLDFGLGEYIVQNSTLADMYFPMRPQYMRIHFKEEKFTTNFPEDEFPRDFPNESEFKKRHKEVD